MFLGHSIGVSELGYFIFLSDATRVHNSKEVDVNENNDDLDPIDELHNRLQNAVSHGGYQIDFENLDAEHIEAVTRKYSREQDERNKEFQKMFFDLFGKDSEKDLNEASKKTVTRIDDAF